MSNGKRLKNLFKDTGAFALGSLGSKILTFLLVPLYTNILSTAEYGVASIILTTVSVLFPIFTLAISEGTLRFAMDKNYRHSDVLSISLAFNFGSIILLFISFFIIQQVGTTIIDYWLYFILYYLGMALHDSLSQYIKGIGKTKLFALQGIIHTFFIVAFNILFLIVFDMRLEGYLLATILGYFCTILFIVIAGGVYKDFFHLGFNERLLKEMLFYSIPMIPTIIAWWANSAIDRYIIIAMEGYESNGLYSIAGKIPSILSIVTTLFTQAWQLSSIKSFEDDDFEGYFNNVYYSYFVVSILATSLLILFNKYLCALLFAKEFYSAWVYVPLLLLANEFSSLSGMLASAFRAFKKTKTLFISTLIGAIVNLLSNLVLIKSIGTIGAAFATMASFFIVWIVRMIFVQKLLHVRLPFAKTILSFASILIIVLVSTLSIEDSNIIAWSCFIFLCLINVKKIVALFSKSLSMLSKRMKKKVY